MSINYVEEVERVGGVAKTVICQDGSIKATFAISKAGKVMLTSRQQVGAMVYDRSALYIAKPVYMQMVKQAYGILKGGQR